MWEWPGDEASIIHRDKTNQSLLFLPLLLPLHPTWLTRGAPHNGVVLVHSLKELPNDQWHGLDPLHLLLSIEVLCTQVLELILDIVLLNLQYMYTTNKMM